MSVEALLAFVSGDTGGNSSSLVEIMKPVIQFLKSLLFENIIILVSKHYQYLKFCVLYYFHMFLLLSFELMVVISSPLS